MRKNVIILILLPLLWGGKLSATVATELNVHLYGKNFQKLELRVISLLDNLKTTIQGTRQDSVWTFSIPDSLYDRHEYLLLREATDSAFHILTLKSEDMTQSIGSFSIDKGKTDLYLDFLKQDTLKEETGPQHERIFYERFSLLKPVKYISNMAEIFNKYDTYSQYDRLLPFVKQHPSMHYCTSYIDSNIELFRPDELKALYNALSKEQQESPKGRRIAKVINQVKFPDISLPTTIDGPTEFILKEHKKYTLFVFSASWCVPCRAEIPLLLKLYKDLNAKGLDIVYITIDEKKTVPAWNAMLKQYHIPWKSYLSYPIAYETLNNLYTIRSIPCSFLVDSKGHYRRVDVRKDNDRNSIYKEFESN